MNVRGSSCIDSWQAAQETSHHLHLDCALTHNTDTRSRPGEPLRAREVEVLSWGQALLFVCVCAHREGGPVLIATYRPSPHGSFPLRIDDEASGGDFMALTPL